VPFELAHDLKFAVSQIHIDPVARPNGSEGATIQRLGNKVADGYPVVGERHTAVGNQHGQRCQGRNARSGTKVEFRHAGGMWPVIWESGQIRPRDAQLPAIAALRKMGRREVGARLEALRAAA